MRDQPHPCGFAAQVTLLLTCEGPAAIEPPVADARSRVVGRLIANSGRASQPRSVRLFKNAGPRRVYSQQCSMAGDCKGRGVVQEAARASRQGSAATAQRDIVANREGRVELLGGGGALAKVGA